MDAISNPVVIIAGTRPEVIKLARVYHKFIQKNAPVEFWMTGQHLSLANGPAEFFDLKCDVKWKLLKAGQSSNELFSKLLNKLEAELVQKRPSVVVVQGDTTTALAGALAAFHLKIPIAHVEAGLRSGDINSPFPEEMNRRVIDLISTWRFPPTELSRSILLKEGHSHVSAPTGNTGIDALLWAREKIKKTGYWPEEVPIIPYGKKLILSTGHRRENLGEPLIKILRALGEEVQKRHDTILIHVAHPNPSANESAQSALGQLDGVHLVPALNYPDFVTLLDRASVVVSDSGGIQEEAPSFDLPVLITRDETERPEVLQCRGILVGTDPNRLKIALNYALQMERSKEGFIKTPFGDGFASERVVNEILSHLQRNPEAISKAIPLKSPPRITPYKEVDISL